MRCKLNTKIINSSVDGSDHLINFGQRHRVREVVSFNSFKNLHRWVKEMGPAIFILLFTIILPIFLASSLF